MSDHESDVHGSKGVDADGVEPELDEELRAELPLEHEPDGQHEPHDEPDRSGEKDAAGGAHRNPERLAHDDPETEEDTASGGPANP